MNAIRSNLTALAALVGGAAFVFTGALQVTQDFSGSHNTIDSTGEYLVTAGLAVALLATVLGYRAFGEMAKAPRVATVTIVPQVVLATMCIISVINGEDASFFNAVAPLCLLTWLGGSIVLAKRLRREDAVPKAVAIAIPLLVPVTIVLSPIGGPMLTGAFWLALGTQALRTGGVRTAVAPAAA